MRGELEIFPQDELPWFEGRSRTFLAICVKISYELLDKFLLYPFLVVGNDYYQMC